MTDKIYFRLSETIAYLNVIFSLIGGFRTTYFIVSCIDSFPTCCIYVSNINVHVFAKTADFWNPNQVGIVFY
jgi:hypothetical protein